MFLVNAGECAASFETDQTDASDASPCK